MNKEAFMQEDSSIVAWKENKEKAFKPGQTALIKRQKERK